MISRVVADLLRDRVARPVVRLLGKFGRADAENLGRGADELGSGMRRANDVDIGSGHRILGAGTGGGDTRQRPHSVEGDPRSPGDSTGSESVPLRVDLTTPEYTEKLAQAPIYRKKGVVRAHPASEDEPVETILADGTRETVNRARAGQIIITNPGGERYIYRAAEPDVDVARAHFDQRHEETSEPGVYKPKGKVRAIPNDTGQRIEIIAPWGEPMNTGADGKIAVPFDPDRPDEVSMDRYLIGGEEFTATYELDT
ncbi:hypothetical protein [Nocardia sp. CC227C]|uniref:hypothetical protein n=1 Tax=Nocardia sp. CC227C TaxID=3044562 RepID=UPI00278BD798|nr:hypothetical protein [Nocardia sp. CC227C]